MPAALLNAGQSRWALHVLVATLSAIAIVSTAPPSGGTSMYSGSPGDIRGLVVLVASVGLVGVLILRTASVLLPTPWTVYVDRLEFTFIVMLWIVWTSSTMAFSAFTIDQGVCNRAISDVFLPTCPLLTFDLTLLHLLSTATLALTLVILSTALAPSYYFDHSLVSLDDDDGEDNVDNSGDGNGQLRAGRGSESYKNRDVLVMWDLALASPVSSLPSQPVTAAAPSYGATEQPAGSNPASSERSSTTVHSPLRRDKFAEGRVWSYVPLLLCSIGAAVSGGVVAGQGSFVVSTVLVIVTAGLSATFAIAFLAVHYNQRGSKVSEAEHSSFLLRHDRALEVACAGALFLLWPLAAVIYTLFPATPNRPCANPAAAAAPPLDLPPDDSRVLCVLSGATITLAWLASWIVLARVMGLVFPMPDVGVRLLPPVSARHENDNDAEEARSLLAASGPASSLSKPQPRPLAQQPPTPPRPQVKYGRLVAGEAFELGDDDEDDD